MWASVDTDNNVTKVYTRPTAITYGDVNYPANVMTSWSNAELATIGVYPVVEDTSNYEGPAYYINTNETFTYYDSVSVGGTTYTDTVVGAYGTATPKNLDDTTDPDTGDVTHGLKWNHNQVIINQAYGLLQPNDWYVVRESEAGTAIPADWTTFRTDVRSTAADMQSKIDACTTVDELAALYVYNDAEPPVRPLGEWPTPPSS